MPGGSRIREWIREGGRSDWERQSAQRNFRILGSKKEISHCPWCTRTSSVAEDVQVGIGVHVTLPRRLVPEPQKHQRPRVMSSGPSYLWTRQDF